MSGMKGSNGMAGMDHSKHGGGHDHGAMIKDYRTRFWIVLAVTIPVMALSPMIQSWLGVNWNFTGDNYLLLVLSSFIFVYGGYPFLKGWWDETKALKPGMMTLIGFAITAAFAYSVATVFGLQGMDFFWEMATLILVMLLGHWIEMKSIVGASRELELLVKLMPSEATMLHGDHQMVVPTAQLKKGDLILVKPGEKIAADGQIEEGQTTLDESMLTGESKPVQRGIGDKVIAGSINGLTGTLKVTVLSAGADSYLNKVIRLVEDAKRSQSRTQLLADKAARWLTLIAIVSGVLTFAGWMYLKHDWAFAIERMVTVIVICCPHALGLAVPLVVAVSTAQSARNGLLIKNRMAFENARRVTTVVFDKTGTLTEGKFQVTKVLALADGWNESRVMQIAYSLERMSEHPIATGIVQKAEAMNLKATSTDNFRAQTGKGITADVNGVAYSVVSPNALVTLVPNFKFPYQANGAETVVYLLEKNQPVGLIVLADKIREESANAIKTLYDHNIKSILLTGDNKTVAEAVSEQLQMDGFIAEVLPHQKLEKIKELQSKGEYVAMTGDGVNDAPALAQANVGIAVGSGSDIAAETAGIVLVNSNPSDIVNLLLFSKATYRKMIQNLYWATGYNVVALPLAAGVLYQYGVLLNPAFGALLMSLSTIVVAINARTLRLKTNQPKPTP